MVSIRQKLLCFAVGAMLIGIASFAGAQMVATNAALRGMPQNSACPDCKTLCGARGGYHVPGIGCTCCQPPS